MLRKFLQTAVVINLIIVGLSSNSITAMDGDDKKVKELIKNLAPSSDLKKILAKLDQEKSLDLKKFPQLPHIEKNHSTPSTPTPSGGHSDIISTLQTGIAIVQAVRTTVDTSIWLYEKFKDRKAQSINNDLVARETAKLNLEVEKRQIIEAQCRAEGNAAKCREAKDFLEKLKNI